MNAIFKTGNLATAAILLSGAQMILSSQASAGSEPSVSVVPPTVSTAGVMEIVVKASDSDGIERVKLYVDDLHVGGDLTAPYEFTWDSYSYAGKDVRIKALARDRKGNKSVDEIVVAIPSSSNTVGNSSSSNATDTVSSGSDSGNTGNAKLLFTSNFESGRIKGTFDAADGWTKEEQGLTGAVTVQSAVTRAGKYASKFYLEKADWDGTHATKGKGKPRAELMKSVRALPFEFDTEYWVGVSLYIPGNWQEDANTNNADIVWQFHATGEVGPYVPPLALRIKGGEITLVNHTGNVRDKIQARELWTGKLEKGRWVDWVVRVNFSLQKGYIQAWKNGTKVADFSGGATIFYDGNAPRRDPLYFKMGLYKPKYGKLFSSTINRTIYMDEVRVAKGGSAGKLMVTPGVSR
ncbi:MAG: heparin lyase I family protein [Pseudomonadales bacterium]|nr:heparin lyase I family protein [Pseudomonadales bacterium]